MSPRVAAVVQEGTTRRVVLRARAARQASGVSQEMFARSLTRAGYPMSRNTWAEFEVGRRQAASIDLVLAVSRVLRVPLLELLGEAVPRCSRCHGFPPTGFACLACGAETGR